MVVTVGSLAKRFYESNKFCTYPTDLLEHCSRYPVVVLVNGKLHRIVRITFARGAMVLVSADAEYKGVKP